MHLRSMPAQCKTPPLITEKVGMNHDGDVLHWYRNCEPDMLASTVARVGLIVRSPRSWLRVAGSGLNTAAQRCLVSSSQVTVHTSWTPQHVHLCSSPHHQLGNPSRMLCDRVQRRASHDLSAPDTTVVSTSAVEGTGGAVPALTFGSKAQSILDALPGVSKASDPMILMYTCKVSSVLDLSESYCANCTIAEVFR